MIEVTFLGVGAALPAPGATNSSYLVRAAGATLLIDCGPAILQQLAGAGLFPWPLVHSSFAPVRGVRVGVDGKVLAFTGDTARCPGIVELARGADLLVHDANHAATVEPMLPDGTPFHSTARDAGLHATQA